MLTQRHGGEQMVPCCISCAVRLTSDYGKQVSRLPTHVLRPAAKAHSIKSNAAASSQCVGWHHLNCIIRRKR